MRNAGENGEGSGMLEGHLLSHVFILEDARCCQVLKTKTSETQSLPPRGCSLQGSSVQHMGDPYCFNQMKSLLQALPGVSGFLPFLYPPPQTMLIQPFCGLLGRDVQEEWCLGPHSDCLSRVSGSCAPVRSLISASAS